MPPPNPFLSALLEGASLTYLCMIKVGLAQHFDPLPRSSSGLGLSSHLITQSLSDHADELCAALLAQGLDPTEEQEITTRQHNSSHYWIHNTLGCTSAPLASIAIAMHGMRYERLWHTLTPQQWRKISPTALPLALLSENSPALDALLAAGVDPNAPDAAGVPPAVYCKSNEMLQKMIARGANLRIPLPRTHTYKESDTYLDWILSKAQSLTMTKSMRETAVVWAEAHPTLGNPLSDLSKLAFKALRTHHKDSARQCIQAMGSLAIEQRNALGENLALIASQNDNYPELGRLIRLGADPFEVSPAGSSPLAELVLTRWGPNSCPSWKESALSERAKRFLENLETSKKYKNIPWTRLNAKGVGLLESLINKAPMHRFCLYAQSSFDAGVDPYAPLSSGMDIGCDLTLQLLRSSYWATNKRDAIEHPEALVLKFLNTYPIEKSSPTSKAAFAHHFWGALTGKQPTNLSSQGKPAKIPLDRLGEARIAVLTQGFFELGRQGTPDLDLTEVDAYCGRKINPVTLELFQSWHLKGALDATTVWATKKSIGPMRM